MQRFGIKMFEYTKKIMILSHSKRLLNIIAETNIILKCL